VILENYHTEMFGKEKVTTYTRPTMYERCMNEWEQWIAWKGRKEFARKKEAEELDRMAQQNAEIQSARQTLIDDLDRRRGITPTTEPTYPYAND
jgi:hypothetical protein